MITLTSLIDEKKCYETVRELRWPEGVSCPHCGSTEVNLRGLHDTHNHRQRYQCQDPGCGKQFDDLTGSIFAGRHQSLRVWICCLYLMGLNLSNAQIAQELGLNKDDVHRMATQLREGIVEEKPEVKLSGEVEFDEVYITAGHKGNPAAVAKKKNRKTEETQRGSGEGHAQNGEATGLRDDPARWGCGHSDAGKRSAGDHQTHH